MILAKNLFFGFLSLTVRFAGSTIFFIIVARGLGVDDFGRVTLAVAVSQILLSVIDYGFNLFAVTEVASQSQSPLALSRAVIRAKLILVLSATGVLAVFMVLAGYTPEMQMMMAVVWVGTILYSYGYFLNTVFRGINEFNHEAAATASLNILQVSSAAVLIALDFGALSVCIAYTASRLVYAAQTLMNFERRFGRALTGEPAFTSMGLLRKTFAFGVHSILAVLYFQVDTVMLSYLLGETAVGYYQASMRLIVASMVLYDVLVSGFYPLIAGTIGRNPEEFRRRTTSLHKSMSLAGVALAGFMALFAESIVDLLYGAEFAPSVRIIQILSVVVFLRFFSAAHGAVITAGENQSKRALAVGLSVIISVASNLMLISQYGIEGAAWASMITHGFLAAAYVYYSWMQTKMSFLTKRVILVMAALTLSFAVIFFLQWNEVVSSLVFCTVLVVAGFISLDPTDWEVLSSLRNRLNKRNS